MSAQTLHDVWLIITVITTLELSGIALYLWRMFGSSSRKWFFWSLALLLASIALEHVSSEIKNLGQPAPPDFTIAALWVTGRIQEAVIAGSVLVYLVFGRNGNSGKH